ncbi:MAG: hypothetical protein US60_C0039G0008 [Microgenomates group bacterium GW2011_GWC1_37_8]|uniref:AAA ATPase n=1 Tax=Candidatus Woesebacteria bacterium GW2011_GWB1_38_8 TaxID=1618570 RepID=A0A0G0P7S6_9BACT|nr:MAG: hypothetical protein US60_C0039G0008 [Microgenomates group bacterium GW2011_GWC1_37_8]KKQ85376.1 MAG: hypothetical protein UT08_C0007G0049 [Candidatus Woesebacteria bacterium GW2011_GWB1_38_8]
MGTYIKRLAEAKIKSWFESNKILLVLGARQVGKTTLLKHMFHSASSQFLNLDIEIDKQRLLAASSLPPSDALISLGKPKVLVIDEAQRLPEVGRIVKGWYDVGVKTKIVLSGSSSLDLLDRFAESLAGRNVKVFLSSLVFQEVLSAQTWYSVEFGQKQLENFSDQINSLILLNLVFGSYPEVITSADKIQYLTNLTSDYLLKDVLQLGLVKNPTLIHKLLSLLAYQSGSVVSVNELSNSLNVSRQTIERYLDLLERTYVIFRLSSYSTNPRKEIAKRQKVYFWDTGVRNALIGEFNLNLLRSDIGQLWENWVVAEFAKKNTLAGSTDKLYFWRSRSGSEVDLVVKKYDGTLLAYEIKWTSSKALTKAFTGQYHVPVTLINKNNFVRILI